MNMTYVRVAFYCLAPLIGMLPGVQVNADTLIITINIQTALAGIATGVAASGGVFKIWGKK